MCSEASRLRAQAFDLLPQPTPDLRPVHQHPQGPEATVIEEQSGPPGREIDLRISGQSLDDLRAAAEKAKALLARFPGVSDVNDDLPYGKQEAIIEVTPRGRALGFTTKSVGRQVRNVFEGAIAKRFARGDEEITVRVLYARDSLSEADLRGLYLINPNGHEVPLGEATTNDRRYEARFSNRAADDLCNSRGYFLELFPAALRDGRHPIRYYRRRVRPSHARIRHLSAQPGGPARPFWHCCQRFDNPGPRDPNSPQGQ